MKRLLLISEFLTKPEIDGLFTRANGTAWPSGVESVAVSAVVVPEWGEISGTLTCLCDVWTKPFGAPWKKILKLSLDYHTKNSSAVSTLHHN